MLSMLYLVVSVSVFPFCEKNLEMKVGTVQNKCPTIGKHPRAIVAKPKGSDLASLGLELILKPVKI